MSKLDAFFKKYALATQLALVLIAGIFLCIDANRPLVDYDEATYAQVVVDTMHSGNFLTLQHQGNNWFEKPPLYIWSAMASAKIFGEREFAFRLPGIIASVLCCWLVYLIALELTGDPIAAMFGFLTLLFSSAFFAYAREMRLDSAVVASLLAALFFFIKSRKNEKYLFWVFPCIAIGFLFKSVIILLVLPIILLYSVFYKKWTFIKSRYLWLGGLPALAIIVPWHLYETIRFGNAFWDNYLGVQVFHRAAATMTGTNNPGDYFVLFVPWFLPSNWPWNFLIVGGFIALCAAAFSEQRKRKVTFTNILPPVLSAVFIFTVFTSAQTHLAPYIMPAFPFFAICVAILYYDLSFIWPQNKTMFFAITAICILIAAAFCMYLMPAKIPPYTGDEKAVGEMYKQQNPNGTPLYLLDFIPVETFDYYGNARAIPVNPADVTGKPFKGPFYMAVSPAGATYFPNLKVLYTGSYFDLLYSPTDIQMPILHWNP
ncbi:MAG: glycosyltransferase family 39 protein [Minisyncoccia bacterium]